MSPDHNHQFHIGAALFACMMSVAALFISLGPCIEQDDVKTKVDHFEQRLDNIQDHR